MRRRSWTRAALLAAIALLVGCDTAARDTILQGTESAVSTLGMSLIHAMFQALGSHANDQPINTVKVRAY